MRILHVGPATPAGGIGAYVLGLVATLGPGWNCHIADVGVPGFVQRHRLLRPFLTGVFLFRVLLALVRRRPDIVHIHTSDSTGFWEKALLAQMVRLVRRPYAMHLHGGTFDVFLAGLGARRARLARAVLDRAAAVIVPARSWLPLLGPFASAAHTVALPNAIRVRDFEGVRPRPPDRPPRLLFLGMISARKGFDELLEALLELATRRRRTFHADIVGADEVPGAWRFYRDAFRRAGLEPWVTWHGPAFGDAKRRFMLEADIFVLPSRGESFGIANLEAMASGLAIVTTRTGAVPEYLESGVHGLVVEPGDVAALTEALDRLLLDPELIQRLGEAARTRVAAYDWSVVAPQVAALYRKMSPDPTAAATRG